MVFLTGFEDTQKRYSGFASQELKGEEMPLMLNKDTIDRAIMARLLDPPEQYPQWPLHYLIGCYGRATAEIRALSTLKDKDAANRIQLDIQYCKRAHCIKCWAPSDHVPTACFLRYNYVILAHLPN